MENVQYVSQFFFYHHPNITVSDTGDVRYP